MPPPFLEVSTAIGCPVDCAFCPQAAAVGAYHGPRLMPLATFTACLAKMPPGTEVSFAGFAEPWLNKQTTAMAEHCHAAGVPWQTYTTCVGMGLDDVDRIVAARPTRIKLHLPDAEGYAKIRVDDAYLAVIRRLKDKYPVGWMTMGTLPPAVQAIFGKTKAAAMHTRAGTVAGMEKRYPLRKRGPLKCRAAPALDRHILLPDGSLALCCFCFTLEHIVGNLMEQTWDEIRTGPALADVRALMASDDGDCRCRTCEIAMPASEKIKG